MAYATVSDLKAYINTLTGGVQTSFTEAEDDLLQEFLDEATREIEVETGRVFAAANGTRYFDRSHVAGQTLYLDADLQSLTSIANGDGSAIATGNVTLWPYNSTPKFQIRLKAGYSWAFTDQDSLIAVVGSWGFSPSPPKDVERATKRLAYFYWMKRSATGEVSVLGDGTTNVPSEYPADVARVLKRYKRSGQP